MPHQKIQLLYYLQVSCNKIHTTFNIFYREKEEGEIWINDFVGFMYEEWFQIFNRLCYSKL